MSRDELLWRPRLATDLENLRAAAGWAFDAPSVDDVTLGIAILGGLMNELTVKPSWGIQAWALSALGRADELTSEQRSILLAGAAVHFLYTNEPDQAIALGKRVIAEAGTLTSAVVNALLVVAYSTALFEGDPTAGMALFTQGLQMPSPIDYVRYGLQTIAAMLAYFIGEYDSMRPELEQALTWARATGTPSILVAALATHARALCDERPETRSPTPKRPSGSWSPGRVTAGTPPPADRDHAPSSAGGHRSCSRGHAHQHRVLRPNRPTSVDVGHRAVPRPGIRR